MKINLQVELEDTKTIKKLIQIDKFRIPLIVEMIEKGVPLKKVHKLAGHKKNESV